MTSRNLPIAIVGAGIGGLSLVRALQTNDFRNVRAYEALPAAALNKQAHLIGVTDEAIQALCGIGIDAGSLIAPIRQRLDFAVGASTPSVTTNLPPRVEWSRLAKTLYASVEPLTVQHEHSLKTIDIDDEGLPLLGFANGERTSARLVIFADGRRSKARMRLTPDQQLEYVGYVIVQGETDLDSTDLRLRPDESIAVLLTTGAFLIEPRPERGSVQWTTTVRVPEVELRTRFGKSPVGRFLPYDTLSPSTKPWIEDQTIQSLPDTDSGKKCEQLVRHARRFSVVTAADVRPAAMVHTIGNGIGVLLGDALSTSQFTASRGAGNAITTACHLAQTLAKSPDLDLRSALSEFEQTVLPKYQESYDMGRRSTEALRLVVAATEKDSTHQFDML